MKIWYSSYQLFPKSVINSKIKIKYRPGALLRVRFDNGNVGYADLCPFSEMGDQPLELELKNLLQSKPSALTQRALTVARLDADARAEEKSLYNPKVRVKNHFLINDLHTFEQNRLETLEKNGYSEFKIKLGRDLNVETEKLQNICERLSTTARVRLDFNFTLTRDKFLQWFDKAQKWLRPSLEFVEDAFAYNAKEWREVNERWNIMLALDFAPLETKIKAEGAQIVVIKPALEDDQKILKNIAGGPKKVVYTHYMDFPLGQMAALIAAENAALAHGDKILTCGLQHHDIYEGFIFQSAIKHDGPFILPPEGYGLGFDALLEKQKWIELQ
jgi:o-succinylbenzoate synthase